MSQAIRQKIASKVKELRVLKGLSKEKLSLMLGLDNSYISKLEQCKINISIEKLESIADFFDVHITDFLT